MDDAFLRIDAAPPLAVPRAELVYRATRSGGPGGQHVNTSATRIELIWNLERSAAPTDAQRARLREQLVSRIDGEGNVRVVASKHRSQHQNREEATARFQALLERALAVRKPRKRTRPPKAANEERLRAKKRRSELKQQRSRLE
jgi:ribosome-associated protein